MHLGREGEREVSLSIMLGAIISFASQGTDKAADYSEGWETEGGGGVTRESRKVVLRLRISHELTCRERLGRVGL